MMNAIILYAGSILITLWGVAHIFPTKAVVAGFGAISEDNQRIITMEWVGEGLALCFIGLLVLGVTFLGGAQNPVSMIVYRASALMLLVMAGWTALTGAKTSILPIKICPFIKTVVAMMFYMGGVL